MWGVDVSFGHSTVNYVYLATKGASFVVGYVSDHPEKNLTAADLHKIRSAQLIDLIVFEDTVTDMTEGAAGGHRHGATANEQAAALGYDRWAKPIFAANDRDAHPADFETILAYMEAFAAHVPLPGYYGDQDSIDFLAARHPDWTYWQSDSTAFGTGISRHAHIMQRYADSRVAGLPVDANDVQIAGIPWLGDDMFTDTDRAMLTKMAGQLQIVSYTEGIELPAIAEIRGNARAAASALVTLHTAPDPVALAAALAPLLHTVDPHELQAALATVLAQVKLTVTG